MTNTSSTGSDANDRYRAVVACVARALAYPSVPPALAQRIAALTDVKPVRRDTPSHPGYSRLSSVRGLARRTWPIYRRRTVINYY